MKPLAERVRPYRLSEFIGQKHLVGETGVLKKTIDSGFIPSMILWGPPGVGKTTLAQIIANELKRPFYPLSAVHSGVKDVRSTIEKAEKNHFFDRPNPILFIDEIHRFSKSQQDSLLGAVEKGIVTLIGATTENPSFEVISALLSRCQVYILNPLTVEELMEMAAQALEKDDNLNKKNIQLKEKDSLIRLSGGDGRRLLNVLELFAAQEDPVMTNEIIESLVAQNLMRYDKGGDQHYDMISAMIKSIRGSDPQAAVYWLARMLEGGEDIKFIGRRMTISAAEDIGLANPNALLLANAAFQSIQMIGMPEARIVLSEVAIYLATSPKSNSAYQAIKTAQELVIETGNLPVPLHLRNAPTSLMKSLGHGKDYKYAHDYQNNFVEEHYLPEAVDGKIIYQPGSNSMENKIKERLKMLWKTIYKY